MCIHVRSKIFSLQSYRTFIVCGSNRLTGVAFPAKLQGESNPPCEQSISAAEKKEKEFTLFNKSLDGLEQAFPNVSFDGFPASVNKIHCGEDNLMWPDIDQIRLYLKTPVRKLHEFSQLRVDFLKMIVHMDRPLSSVVVTDHAAVNGDLKSCETSLERPTTDYQHQLYQSI